MYIIFNNFKPIIYFEILKNDLYLKKYLILILTNINMDNLDNDITLNQIFGIKGSSKIQQPIISTNVKKETIPWIDKYRPKKINGIVYQDEVINLLRDTLKTGNLPHLLFFGPPGTGKTSTILAVCYELFGPLKFKERVIELNASDERGINIVRNEIITFAKSIIGKPDPHYPCPPFKVVILDEADAMTAEAQSALRKVMENTSQITRFCIICNYENHIIEPLNSRCMRFRFKPIHQVPMKNRLQYISQKEKLNINDQVLDQIVNLSYGDMRKAIMILQNVKYINKLNGHTNHYDINEIVGYVPMKIVKNIWNVCKNDHTKNSTNIINHAQQFYLDGYPVYNFMEQIDKYVLDDKDLDTRKKSLIFSKIFDVMVKLNEGADGFIQLIRILLFINMVTHNKIMKI